MKETAKKRCTLLLKFWKEGAEKDALEGTMTTDSLRAARAEFRSKMRSLLPYDALPTFLSEATRIIPYFLRKKMRVIYITPSRRA